MGQNWARQTIVHQMAAMDRLAAQATGAGLSLRPVQDSKSGGQPPPQTTSVCSMGCRLRRRPAQPLEGQQVPRDTGGQDRGHILRLLAAGPTQASFT